jgi:hypothetical protein
MAGWKVQVLRDRRSKEQVSPAGCAHSSKPPLDSLAGGWANQASGLRNRILEDWGRTSFSLLTLFLKDHTLRTGRKDSEVAWLRLSRGPRPDHLWSQCVPANRKWGEWRVFSTFPASGRVNRGGGHASTSRVGSMAPSPAALPTPSLGYGSYKPPVQTK